MNPVYFYPVYATMVVCAASAIIGLIFWKRKTGWGQGLTVFITVFLFWMVIDLYWFFNIQSRHNPMEHAEKPIEVLGWALVFWKWKGKNTFTQFSRNTALLFGAFVLGYLLLVLPWPPLTYPYVGNVAGSLWILYFGASMLQEARKGAKRLFNSKLLTLVTLTTYAASNLYAVYLYWKFQQMGNEVLGMFYAKVQFTRDVMLGLVFSSALASIVKDSK